MFRPRPLLLSSLLASHPLRLPLDRLSSTVQDRQDARIWNLRRRQGGRSHWDWKGACCKRTSWAKVAEAGRARADRL